MEPRLISSKKWTSFPIELSEQIHSILEENFREKLGEGEFIVEGRIYSEEVLFRIGFSPKDRLFQANFEASVDYIDAEQVQAAIDLSLDATASMMEDYYESNERIDLPRNWGEYKFNGQKIFLQFSTCNTNLEAEANKILGLLGSSLVHEEESKSEDYYDQH